MKKDGFMSMTLVYTFLILFLFIMLAILNAYSHENKYLEAIENKVKDSLKQTASKDESLLNKIISDNTPTVDTGVSFGTAATSGGLFYTSSEDSGDENNDKTGRRLYYFRGNVTNNYVKFAGYCWRIVRTNENGSIRLLYHSSTNDSKCNKAADTPLKNIEFNAGIGNNTDVGYMYGTATSTTHYGYNYYDTTHENLHETTIKTKLEEWYKNNIANKEITTTSRIVNSIYCNDRSLGAEGTISSITYGEYGFSKFPTLYGSTRRNATGGSYGTTFTGTGATPTFKCMQVNDQFTVSEANGGASYYGNNDAKYPVGFLTVDEVIYAGGSYGNNNTTYYLKDYPGWTMTPFSFNGTNASMFVIGANGKVETKIVNSSNTANVVPVISINSDILVTKGDGTKGNPYILEEENNE